MSYSGIYSTELSLRELFIKREMELSSREIVQRNYDQIITHTDLTTLEDMGHHTKLENGAVVGRQQERRGSVCVDTKTGEVLAAGPSESIPLEVLYSKNAAEMELWVGLSDGSNEYWFEPPADSEGNRLKWSDFLSETAMRNLDTTLSYCNDPSLASR